jgi:hypothetical protein
MMHGQTLCLWCAAPVTLRRGGSPRKFCSTRCRHEFHSCARRWAETAIATGGLSVDVLKNSDAAAACTLPEREEPTLPLTGIGSVDPAAPDKPLRFLVEVEHHIVAGLVKLGFVRREESEELGAIFDGMKRLGWLPHISRIS